MNSPLPESVDVVVIGGGIVGCSTAYYLARAGNRVMLCEKGEIAGEQSSRNWGFIRKQGRDPAEIPLMLHAERCWHELSGHLGPETGFHVGGTIYLSETEQRYQANLAWLERTRDFELDSLYLTEKELSDLIPGIHGQSRGALYTPSDCRAEPGPSTRGIAALAKNHGAIVHEGCAVRGIDLQGGRVAGVYTEHGRVASDAVVCAGGAWSGYFCRHLGIVFPHLKVVSSVMATAKTSHEFNQNLWSAGLGLRRRLDGGYNVAFGGSSSCHLTPDFLRFCLDFLPAYRTSKEQVSIHLGKRFLTEFSWPSRWDMDTVTPFEKERILDPEPDHSLLDRAYDLLG